MPTIRVRRPGLLTTVQDLGRAGLGRFGVSPSGAMDPFAVRVANRLVGNDDRAAALEVTAVGPEIEFVGATVVALGGGNLRAALDGVPIEPWTAVAARAGAILRFGGRLRGARCYVAFAGGIRVPSVLGSAATDLEAGIGGLEGRALRAGDELELGPADPVPARTAHVGVHRPYADPFLVRFVPAGEDQAAAAVVHSFTGAQFRVSRRSNRMGYRLEGATVLAGGRSDGVSEPVPPGTIQLPPDGQPIVLMADRPTIGGYPRVGCVIAADIPKVAQLWPGHTVRFQAVSVEQAREALREQHFILAAAVPL